MRSVPMFPGPLVPPLVTADTRDEQRADSTRPRPGNVLICR